MKRYNNYHKHTCMSNIRSLDCVVQPIEYIKRAKELDNENAIYFTTEHGWQGDIFSTYTLCKEHNVKMIVGAEVYYVEDRLEKDKTNYHLVMIAKNEDGRKDLNRILSESNKSGFYYKPRIDNELLFSVNPNNLIITSACVAGRLRNEEGLDEWILQMKNFFKKNFYLEVQNHNEETQKNHNQKILNLSKKYDIEIIHANDSHYIYKEDAKYRDLFLKAKGIVYEDESTFILDYPTYDEIVERYRLQGVLSDEEIERSLKNTLIFDDFKGVVINDEIKMPHICEDPKQELRDIINKEWSEREIHEVDENRIDEYLDAIREEMKIIEDTNMSEYFVLDYKIMKRGKEKYGGVLTRTGRGSAPSFYINKLLRFTDIDRLSSSVKLFPSRFMSTTRILETKSLPDIDMNTADPNPYIQASKDILGEDGVYYMVAFKPLQDASAFRLWCKANDMNIKDYDDIAKNLDDYTEDEYWGSIIEESKRFKGVVESVAPSPCSFLLLDRPISEEIGLIKVGDIYCCCIDGYNCDKYKYLKNDILTVSVWKLIKETCDLIGIEIPTIKELEGLLNDKTYSMYELGLTCTLNQADSDFATPLFQRFAPKNIAEVSQMVAVIRPGASSMLNDFLDRKPYTTGFDVLDDLLKDSKGRMLYQESVMSFLIWLGVPEAESYGVLKKIAKKRFTEKELKELHKQLVDGWIDKIGDIEGFQKMWEIVEANAKYSFNSSHSLSVGLDSLYGAYLKANYPLEYYTVAFNNYDGDIERTAKLTEELKYFEIQLRQPKFRYANAQYLMDKENKSIYKGLSSIKYLNDTIAEQLYELRDNQYNSFSDLLVDIKEKTSCNSRQLEILVKLDFFSEFNKRQKLLETVEMFNKIYSKKQFKKDSLPCKEELIRQFAQKETDRIFKEVDTLSLCKFLESNIANLDMEIEEIIKAELEYLGSPAFMTDELEEGSLICIDVNTKYTPKILFYNPTTGGKEYIKISKKLWKNQPLDIGDIIIVYDLYEKEGSTKVDGKWIPNGKYEWWLNKYKKIN